MCSVEIDSTLTLSCPCIQRGHRAHMVTRNAFDCRVKIGQGFYTIFPCKCPTHVHKIRRFVERGTSYFEPQIWRKCTLPFQSTCGRSLPIVSSGIPPYNEISNCPSYKCILCLHVQTVNRRPRKNTDECVKPWKDEQHLLSGPIVLLLLRLTWSNNNT